MIKHIHVNECDSTQDLLKEQLSGFTDPHEILVSCNNQLNGHGRGTNRWISLPGSLCFSLTIKPHPIASLTAMELSVLVAKFFEGSILTLKWPNDIWNKQKKKCCGILVQTFQGTMVAGIGLNLFSDHEVFGGVYDSSFEFDKNSWSFELSQYILDNRYVDAAELRKEWTARCGHIGEAVLVTEGDEEVEGIFRGIGSYGEALLETPSGERRLFNGTLRLLNPDH